MVYNYSHLPKLPCTAFNSPVSALPVLNCAQACTPPAYVPCATNSCQNHFNSYHNYYDTCHNLCDEFGFLY
ncbi:hypothetical protein Wxf_03219 [Armadillidium vulgare]|nr:hypothetical protein Wxf_03219 [Armadillidium vulgare] [Wolbachia endosymbiont of Armadillidium vulgare]